MKKDETYEEFRRRHHCAHTSTDEMEEGWWQALGEISELKQEIKRLEAENERLRAQVVAEVTKIALKPFKLTIDDLERANTDLLSEIQEGAFAQMLELDAAAFIRSLNLSPPTAEDVRSYIDRLLADGAMSRASSVATVGSRMFPEDDELQKYARVLAPPTAEVVPLPKNEAIRRSQRWIDEHRDEYVGKWVAVGDGVLMGSGDTYEEAMRGLPPLEISVLTKVFK